MKKLFLYFIFLLTAQTVWAAQPLNVVTTQTLFADLVKQIGGDKVTVTAIASPKYNIHFIQPKPSDVRKVSQADLYVNGGLDLEAWSDPLLEAAGKPELFRNGQRNVDLSYGIRLLQVPGHPLSRAEGDIHAFGNPHFQTNPENSKIMTRTITDKLKEFDPANADYYEANAKAFLNKLDQKIAEWKSVCSQCAGKEIISYHDEVVYILDFLEMKDEQYLEPKPGIPPTPKHLVFLEEYAKSKQIKAISVATYFPRDAAEQLAKRLGVKVITIAQEPGEVAGTDDFFSFFDYNIKQISEGIK